MGIADGVDGAINGASGKDLYIITGDNAGVNKVSIMGSSETITAATQGNPCQITAIAHGLETGDEVRLIDIIGMVELNNANYTITKVDDDNFTLDGVNASGFTAYVSGGRFCKEVYDFGSIDMGGRVIVTSGGTLLNSSGNISSASRIAVGTYKINFTTSYSSVNDYVTIGNILTGSPKTRPLIVKERNVAYVVVQPVGDSDNALDQDFNLVITKI
jgi:hypothetical protein